MATEASWASELAFAHELADLAGTLTLPAFGEPLEVARKDDGTPVTDADLGAERALRRAIRARYPHHAVLGEEDGLDGPEGAPTWILDPVDGTKNFVRGNPVWATLVALEVDGRGVVGVVSAPALHTRWDGVRGGPAHQDGREIRVSTVDDLAAAQVSVGSLRRFRQRDLGRLLDGLVRSTPRQRGFGDFWQHCLVASGAVDAAVDPEVDLWDLAAVGVIVRAAGGRLTSLDGEDTERGGDALSSNGLLHEAVLALR